MIPKTGSNVTTSRTYPVWAENTVSFVMQACPFLILLILLLSSALPSFVVVNSSDSRDRNFGEFAGLASFRESSPIFFAHAFTLRNLNSALKNWI